MIKVVREEEKKRSIERFFLLVSLWGWIFYHDHRSLFMQLAFLKMRTICQQIDVRATVLFLHLSRTERFFFQNEDKRQKNPRLFFLLTHEEQDKQIDHRCTNEVWEKSNEFIVFHFLLLLLLLIVSKLVEHSLFHIRPTWSKHSSYLLFKCIELKKIICSEMTRKQRKTENVRREKEIDEEKIFFSSSCFTHFSRESSVSNCRWKKFDRNHWSLSFS